MASKFTKSPTTIQNQIEILMSRGLLISDKIDAGNFLSQVSYYRFCGYGLSYENFKDGERTQTYQNTCKFEDIVNLYNWDATLRIILLDFISSIEISFRTIFCNTMALEHTDSHWHINAKLFYNPIIAQANMDLCKMALKSNSHEVFIKSYLEKYNTPALPPSWMMAEILSFGKWSKTFSNTKFKSDRKKVAQQLNVNEEQLISWIKSIVVLRNSCAHHSRIWNRTFHIRPKFTNRMKRLPLKSDKLGALLYVMKELLFVTGRQMEFCEKLTKHLEKTPLPIEKALGLENYKTILKA